MKKYELDVCGQLCPGPVLEAETLLKKICPGDQIAIYTDHDIVGYNLMDWAEGKGLKAKMDEIESGMWRVTVIKNKKRGDSF
ncbi:MAG: sulfurtransferase TusA family protein [Clostridia bacterium]|jgi:TusA-related sulfurtransferase|nr:sulfurtransferase TusA family protein [Clostridia bacterium]